MYKVKLKGVFTKVANSDGTINFGKSFWTVYDGDSVFFKGTVNNYRSVDMTLSYNDISTTEFGKALLRQARRMKPL